MARFTQFDETKVDEKIEHDLRLAVNIIRAELTGCCSLVLTGGFSRGEGGVLREGGKIIPINDYDIVAITNQELAPASLKSLREMVAKQLDIRLVDIIPMNRSDLSNLPPTQFNYDLKHGGQVLWGEDILKMLPDYKPEDVLLDSGHRVLINRVICLLECYSQKFEKQSLPEDASFFLINQTTKAVLACAEALLIAIGQYHYSYTKRACLFHDHFPKMTELKLLIDWATEFKLRPVMKPSIKPLAYWHKTVVLYLAVLASYPGLFISVEAHIPSILDSKKLVGQLIKKLLLKEDFPLHPIEKIEMYLLAHTSAPFWQRRQLLTHARQELAEISSQQFTRCSWEQLRHETVKTWHTTLG